MIYYECDFCSRLYANPSKLQEIVVRSKDYTEIDQGRKHYWWNDRRRMICYKCHGDLVETIR